MSDTEATPPSIDVEDIPRLVADLRNDQESFSKAYDSLVALIENEPDLATTHLLSHLAPLLALCKEYNKERAPGIIEIIAKLICLNDTTRDAAKSHVGEIVKLLLLGTESTRSSVLDAVEYVLESEDDEAEDTALLSLKNTVFALPTEPTNLDNDSTSTANAAESLQLILMSTKEDLRALSFKAGALPFLEGALTSPSTHARTMAVSCFQQVYQSSEGIVALVPSTEHPDLQDASALQTFALNQIISRLTDTDMAVATAVLDFIQDLELPEEISLRSHPTFAVDLVGYLARWDPEGDIPFPYLFEKVLGEAEEACQLDDNLSLDGFRRVFAVDADRKVDAAIGARVLRAVAHGQQPVREAAVKGGAVAFILHTLKSSDEPVETKLSILEGIVTMIQQDEGFGSHLLSGNVIPTLVEMLVDTSLSPEFRAKSVATLNKITSSYTADLSEPLRKEVVRALIAPDVLPAILSVAQQDAAGDNAKVVAATFELLSDMMYDNGDYDQDCEEAEGAQVEADDEGGEDEDDDSDYAKGPPLPINEIKSAVGRPSLLTSIFAALPNPAIASTAADLLAQLCYERPSTQAEVLETLRTTHIPTAPAAFFAGFAPCEGGSAPVNAHTALNKAVVDAGGLDRMRVILKEEVGKLESGAGTPEERCTAVRAMRALLWGDDVDKDIGRKEVEELPKLVVALIGDEKFESLKEAQVTVELLAEYGVENPFETWEGVVAKDEVVRSLEKWLAIKEPRDLADEEVENDSELAAETVTNAEAWEIFDETITCACWLLQHFLPILLPFHQSIATTLLNTYFYSKRNASPIFSVLDALVSSPEDSISSADPLNPRNAPFVLAIRALLESPPPLATPGAFVYVANSSAALRMALLLGGLLPHVLRILDAESDDFALQELGNSIIEIFEPTIIGLRDPETRSKLSPESIEAADKLLREAQHIFFESPKLIAHFHDKIVQHQALELGEEWDQFQGLTYTHNLYNISAGYTHALAPFLKLEPGLHTPLLKLLGDEKLQHGHFAPPAGEREAPLLGGLLIALYSPESSSMENVEENRRELVDGVTDVFKRMIQGLDPSAGTQDRKGKKKKGAKWSPPFTKKAILEKAYAFFAAGSASLVSDNSASNTSYAVARDALTGVAVGSGILDLAFESFIAGVAIPEAAANTVNGPVVPEEWMFAVRTVRVLHELGLQSSSGSASVLVTKLEGPLELLDQEEWEVTVEVDDE